MKKSTLIALLSATIAMTSFSSIAADNITSNNTKASASIVWVKYLSVKVEPAKIELGDARKVCGNKHYVNGEMNYNNSLGCELYANNIGLVENSI